MTDNRRKRGISLTLERLEDRLAPSATPLSESFDTTPVGQLPTGWAQWSSTGQGVFSVTNQASVSPAHGLAASTAKDWVSAAAWNTTQEPADVEVSVNLFTNNAMPLELVARASGLNTATPTYYGVQILSGMQASLFRMQNGVIKNLGWAGTAQALEPEWVRATFNLSGSTLRAQFFRQDTNQFLDASGHWGASPTWAISVTDTAITSGGFVGLARLPSLAGTLYLDDFRAFSAAGDTQPPAVTIFAPATLATLTGTVQVQANASDNVGIAHVDFYVDGGLRGSVTQLPYAWNFDSSTASNTTHELTVKAYDLAGNSSSATVPVLTSNYNAVPPVVIPQHYPWIRVAELAYAPTQLDSFGQNLLKNSVDLVVTDWPGLQNQVTAAAPGTTQLLYANISTVSQDTLTNWLSYAHAHGISPEEAFYHVQQATPYSGTSPSSQPVNWFWAVYNEGAPVPGSTVTARGTSGGSVSFASTGKSLDIGYTDPFREVNVDLLHAGSATWAAQLEYPTAVNAAGAPTAWAPLKIVYDGTAGLTASGRVTFDPPADWKPASINGTASLYFVRFRTTGTGTPPLAASILGRDYTDARGGITGVIPAFDKSADLNHDGYLSDAEYAKRTPGMDARFLYESRAPYFTYGEMRFSTNPSDAAFRAWATAYITGLVSSQPYSVGILIDNSSGNALVPAVVESVTTYQQDYASLMNSLSRALSPRVLMANSITDAVVTNVTGAYQEFSFGALTSSWTEFEALSAHVTRQLSLRSPPAYLVLDSVPTGGSATDARTQIATLAYYYLVGDPTRTFINFFGGSATNTSWTQHWVPAATYNVGSPLGTWSLLASGADPESPDKTYHVYQRAYGNALVLYKPLSVSANTGLAGTLDNATATTLALSGTYRLLQADGSLSAPVTSVSLRNGEGAILVKA